VNLPDLGLLALVEGVADIFPIDASTHFMIAARLLRLRAESLSPALHLGVSLALALYFWRDMALIASGLWKLRKARIEAGTRMLTKMLIASAPFLLIYARVGGISLPEIDSVFWIGVITLFFAILMFFADKLSLTVKRIEHIGGLTSLAVGLAQMVAFIPGVGRLPAALILARLFGMERSAAYRFVLLSSLPVLLGQAAGDFLRGGQQFGFAELAAFIISFGAALAALPVGFALMRRSGLLPFALYRLVFGAALVGLSLI